MKKEKEEVDFQRKKHKPEVESKDYVIGQDSDFRVKNSRRRTKFKKCRSFVK